MEPDSLQAARDTVVILQAQSNSWLDWASFVVSLLIAGFTGGYLWYTMGIFEKTEEQAKAARESAKASRRSLEEQRSRNQQRRLERSHPLVWVDFNLSIDEESKDGIDLEFRNGSALPAMGISGVVISMYSPWYCDWHTLKLKSDVDVPNLQLNISREYGIYTKFSMGGIESHSSTKLHFKYPIIPKGIDLLFQYKDIHGNHYGRIFWAKAIPESIPRPGNNIHHSDAIETYSSTGVLPHGIREIEPIVWESDLDGEYLLLKKDAETDSPTDVVERYRNQTDEFIRSLGGLNGRLAQSISSFHFPPFEATVSESDIFPTDISQVTDNFRV